MRKKQTNKITARLALTLGAVLLVGLACDLSSLNATGVQIGQPEAEQRRLFEGVTYQRIVRQSPRRMVIHVVKIDLKADGIKTLVTPGDTDQARPLSAKTTSQFLKDFNLQIAVNGDAFTPWQDLGPLGYSPKPGERVTPLGLAASRGKAYSIDSDEQPTLYLNDNGKASINVPSGKLYNAISGYKLLVWRNNMLGDLDTGEPDPRTAVGVNRAGNQVIIVVVDGRQPGYSEGITENELAALLIELNVYSAMNLDGGGSSTLVIEGENGEPLVLNSPVHQGVPGNERPVGNHLGFNAR
ncbi:MAG: phosphodiester glycosidase family protein [Anaerolineales bacterium]